MGIIFDALLAFFAEDDWPVSLMEEETAASVTVRGESGYWDCVAQALEEERLFLFYSAFPFDVPRGHSAPMAEFVARATFGVFLGNFELDIDGGHLRCKTSVSVRHIPDETLLRDGLLQRLIRQAVYTNIAMMDRHVPGITAVLDNGVPPVEALARVED
jgi:hypothetical protein